MTVMIDVTDPHSVITAATEVKTRFPELNVLVVMSGIMLPEDLHISAFLDVAERTVATNLLGTIRVVVAFTEFLAARPNAAILTVSSGLAFVPLPFTPTYKATKAAIHSFTCGMRQLKNTNIQVIELIPPGVRTTLMGQQNCEQSMPLADFLDETMDLLGTHPDAKEILVEPVKFVHFSEINGTYDNIVA